MNDNRETKLSNGVMMPRLIQGLPLIMKLAQISKTELINIVHNSIEVGVKGFDTSHDYGKSEEYLKDAFINLRKSGVEREDFFITSKIGNAQQYEGNIEKYVDDSLKTMGLEYLDLMLLHWPVPELYIKNWEKLEKVYAKGKVRAIGIANARVRHIQLLLNTNVEVTPHVIQTEIHPFNTCKPLRDYCASKNISLQACSSLCMMIDKVKYNPLLNEIAAKYEKSIAQVMLRWLLQNNISPVFRAFKKEHMAEMSKLFDFNIDAEDMGAIANLNENFRYHPESINCSGF